MALTPFEKEEAVLNHARCGYCNGKGEQNNAEPYGIGPIEIQECEYCKGTGFHRAKLHKVYLLGGQK